MAELALNWSRLAAVDMEGGGTAQAAYDSDHLPGPLVVKGISDWADAGKNDDWQEYAADAAAPPL